MNDELLDLVDQFDQIIGQKLRSEVYKNKLSNFRVVNAFLINEQEQLWIPRRSEKKRLFPSCLDASMGGHVMAGESYQDALERELMEELRIDAKIHNPEHIGSLNPHAHGTSAFMHVYLLQVDIAPDYNPTDFCDYYWLTPQEVLNQLSNGDTSKDDLPRIIKHLLL